MIVFIVCSAVLTLVVGQVESNTYSSYSAPQRPCSGGNFCGGHPNSLPFEPRYPSLRVGVSPGYPGDSEGNYESNEVPEKNCNGPSKEVSPLNPPPPPTPCDDNQLPVSVCVQLPPKTPLKLSKSILQQIIFSLTETNQHTESANPPALPEPVTLPVYSHVQVPVYSPQPAYAPPPQPAVPAPQPPIYSPQPSCPLQPPPPPPQVYVEPPVYAEPPVYSESPVYAESPVYVDPPVYAEPPIYAPQPASPVHPVPEPVVYEPEPTPTTPAPIPDIHTPRYPTYDTNSGSTGASGQLPPYVQQARPGGTCHSCGSSLKPRYNQ